MHMKIGSVLKKKKKKKNTQFTSHSQNAHIWDLVQKYYKSLLQLFI